jgi:hypothetical protein
VLVLASTETVRPGAAKAAAEPLAAIALVQVELVYSLTVEPPSAAPRISGKVSFAGEAGLVAVSVGRAGALASATYVIELDEHAEALPAASVAVA